jgi:hypothetical protein
MDSVVQIKMYKLKRILVTSGREDSVAQQFQANRADTSSSLTFCI